MEPLIAWLEKRKKLWMWQNIGVGLAGLLGAFLLLFLTFWFTYAVVWAGGRGVSALSEIIFSQKVHVSHSVRLTCSAIFLILLFVQYLRTDSWHWGDYAKEDYDPALGIGANVGGSLGALLMHPGASANMIADILLSGPRLSVGSVRMIQRGLRIRRLDENGCAELLGFLLSRNSAVPYEELTSAGWSDWLPQLRSVEGVNFLQKGIILSAELKAELNALNQG